jgi:hypothetical protein
MRKSGGAEATDQGVSREAQLPLPLPPTPPPRAEAGGAPRRTPAASASGPEHMPAPARGGRTPRARDLPGYGRQPDVHPDTGRPLRTVAQGARPPVAATLADDLAAAAAASRAPRFPLPRRRPFPPGCKRNPVVGDALRLRSWCCTQGVSIARRSRGWAVRLVVSLGRLCSIVHRDRARVGELVQGCTPWVTDVAAAAVLRMPGWYWLAWEKAEWRRVWSSRQGRDASRWLGVRGFPWLRPQASWRRAWGATDWPCRTWTASEWSRRTGRPIPDWLQS